MPLKYITIQSCPDCNCSQIVEEQYLSPKNTTEKIRFECGFSLHIINNKEIYRYRCTNSTAWENEREERKILFRKLEEIIIESKIDNKFKEKFLENLKYKLSRESLWFQSWEY